LAGVQVFHSPQPDARNFNLAATLPGRSLADKIHQLAHRIKRELALALFLPASAPANVRMAAPPRGHNWQHGQWPPGHAVLRLCRTADKPSAKGIVQNAACNYPGKTC